VSDVPGGGDALAIEFERWLSHILATAAAAGRHPAEWDGLRRAWIPEAPASAPHVGDAAHPSDVRQVLLALEAAFEARLPPEHPGESEAMWDFRRRRLVDFVRDETEAYIARVTPTMDLGSLFARAAAGLPARPDSPAGSGPSVAVLTCRSCGAPRQRESLYGRCGYCGTPFFPAG